jgi:hypothetical protein
MTSVGQVRRTLIWVAIFGAAFAFVESAVVVYLRALYYPEGFVLPLKGLLAQHLTVEVARETATIAMLCAVAMMAGRKAWERFGYFMVAFGVWDIFYYVWLKVLLGWPASAFDWDVLFLIPVPWIGPVVAPLLVALAMVGCGVAICLRIAGGRPFQPRLLAWALGVAGTAVLLFSFLSDTDATLHGLPPQEYRYGLLAGGLLLLLSGFGLAWRSQAKGRDGLES